MVKTIVKAKGEVFALSRTKETLDSLANESDRIHPIVADVGDWNGTRKVLDELDAMDGVVNNAGEVIHISAINPALDCPKEVFDRSINIHLLGTINVIQMMGRKMVEVGKAGSIVNVSRYKTLFNPLVTNRLSHPYHLDESKFILGASGVVFHFCFIF